MGLNPDEMLKETTEFRRNNHAANLILTFFLFSVAAFSCKKVYVTEITEVTEIVTPPEEVIQPKMLSFGFKPVLNPSFLNDSLDMDISESVISGRIPYYTNIKNLTPVFETNGGVVTVNGVEQQSGETSQDFSKEVVYQITNDDGLVKSYTIRLVNFTGLPVIKIMTDRNAIIDSKENYVTGTMTIDGFGIYEDYQGTFQIKGRGNTTWGMPKKPYRLKLDKKAPLFGMPENKHWVLLADYADKTSLRTHTAFYMGEISKLEWTPRGIFAELFINEVYQGTYEFVEKIEVAKERVNVTDDGYILEVDQESRMTADDVWFKTGRILVNIKEPGVVLNDEKYNYVKNYVTAAEDALYSDDFLDAENGYRKYLDMESFVDWYLINEITKNTDAIFFSSCYMSLKPGEKLKMGPLWDFDISLGNTNYNGLQPPQNFWIKNSIWYKRMFLDPEFVTQVKQRFDYFYSRRNDILNEINSKSSMLHWSIIENNNKWGTLYTPTWPNYAVWGSYDNEVMYMKNWFNTRFEWLKTEFEAL